MLIWSNTALTIRCRSICRPFYLYCYPLLEPCNDKWKQICVTMTCPVYHCIDDFLHNYGIANIELAICMVELCLLYKYIQRNSGHKKKCLEIFLIANLQSDQDVLIQNSQQHLITSHYLGLPYLPTSLFVGCHAEMGWRYLFLKH